MLNTCLFCRYQIRTEHLHVWTSSRPSKLVRSLSQLTSFFFVLIFALLVRIISLLSHLNTRRRYLLKYSEFYQKFQNNLHVFVA
jgi:hypothetical protein